MATVKLTDKPVVQELMDGDQVVLIQKGAVRLIGAEKVGVNGKDGVDGKTPIRGVDYWTEEDVSAMHSYIDERLGEIENGTY